MNDRQRAVVIGVCSVVAVLLHLAYWQWGWLSRLDFPFSAEGIGLFQESWFTKPNPVDFSFVVHADDTFGLWARTAFPHAMVAGLITPVLIAGLGLFVFMGRKRQTKG